MKSVKKMTYRELEAELLRNRLEFHTASLERRRILCRRDADLMDEMDYRWSTIDDWYRREAE